VKSWDDVPPLWQACFRLAWESYREGSNPIAALVADADGRIVATGKSAVRTSMNGVVIHHNELAHAEVNALLALDNREHDKQKAAGYTLYATLEPCPVCFASFYMSDVLTLCFAARDRFGGSTNLIGTTPYLSRKSREIAGPVDGLEDISIFLNVYHDLEKDPQDADVLHDALAVDCPAAVAAARRAIDSEVAGPEGLRKESDFAVVFEWIVDWLERDG
jgi:tRNA(Arg) A34 adenosine deaminase TadA